MTAPTASLNPLRRFHLGAPGARPSAGVSRTLAPRSVAPLRGARAVRYDYPLALGDPGRHGELATPRPIGVLLEDTVATMDPAGAARELRDNLARLEQAIRSRVDQQPGLSQLRQVVRAAADEVIGGLALAGDSGQRFATDLSRLVAALPDDTRLMRYDDSAALRLLGFIAQRRLRTRRAALNGRVLGLIDRLGELLDVEKGKDLDAREPGAVSRSMGQASGALFDPAALAALLGPHRGTRVISADRRQRITSARQALLAWDSESVPEVVLAHAPGTSIPPELASVAEGVSDPISQAITRFDRWARVLGDLIRVVRTAELELAGTYDQTLHGEWFSQFDWESFTPDELLLLPVVVVACNVSTRADGEVTSLLKLLLSGRPIQVLTATVPSRDAAAAAGEPLGSYRLDVASLAMGQRVVFVQQSAAARPDHLVRGFERAVLAPRAALHTVTERPAGTPEVGLQAWLEAGAAVEGRAHPLFQFDPDAGTAWAHRMDIGGNPALNSEWPVDPSGANGTSKAPAFTFADYALLDPALSTHFQVIPELVSSDRLVTVAELMAKEPSDWAGLLPYIHASHGSESGPGAPVRLAITRELAMATRERLNAWRSLRELGGVENQHVARAVAGAVAELQAQEAVRHAESEAQHALEVREAAATAASLAMKRLADALVGGASLPDLAAPGLTVAQAPGPAAAGLVAPTAQIGAAHDETPASEAENAESAPAPPPMLAGPWIDSELCTTCGDCLVINSVLFVYDGNKQATIADEEAGSFADLVLAAEACPAKCIHPGAPLNPKEPKLDALIERAKPFNPGS